MNNLDLIIILGGFIFAGVVIIALSFNDKE